MRDRLEISSFNWKCYRQYPGPLLPPTSWWRPTGLVDFVGVTNKCKFYWLPHPGMRYLQALPELLEYYETRAYIRLSQMKVESFNQFNWKSGTTGHIWEGCNHLQSDGALLVGSLYFQVPKYSPIILPWQFLVSGCKILQSQSSTSLLLMSTAYFFQRAFNWHGKVNLPPDIGYLS